MSEKQRREFETNPKTYSRIRKVIEHTGNTVRGPTLAGSETKERLAKRSEIPEILTPPFVVSCRRFIPEPGYLEALVKDNFTFISDKTRSVKPNSILLENGKEVDLDAIVCATGFNASGAPPFGVTGKNGVTLQERYKHTRKHISRFMDGLPNFFMMLGPNAGIGSGSLTMILQTEGDYIVKCIRELQKEDHISMMLKPERLRIQSVCR